MPKIRNILIFVAIAGVLVFAYIFFVKKPSSSQTPDLVSSTQSSTPSATTDTSASATTANFLTLLSGVKDIELNTDIFSDPAFISLHDSSIVLVPDTTTGRPNPFAQFGAEDIAGASGTTPVAITPGSSTGGSTASTTPLSIPVVPKTSTKASTSTHP